MFIQPENRVQYLCVTGVQTCAIFFSSRRRHTRSLCDWSSDVCSSDPRSIIYELLWWTVFHQSVSMAPIARICASNGNGLVENCPPKKLIDDAPPAVVPGCCVINLSPLRNTSIISRVLITCALC